jgi:hypothetical protein
MEARITVSIRIEQSGDSDNVPSADGPAGAFRIADMDINEYIAFQGEKSSVRETDIDDDDIVGLYIPFCADDDDVLRDSPRTCQSTVVAGRLIIAHGASYLMHGQTANGAFTMAGKCETTAAVDEIIAKRANAYNYFYSLMEGELPSAGGVTRALLAFAPTPPNAKATHESNNTANQDQERAAASASFGLHSDSPPRSLGYYFQHGLSKLLMVPTLNKYENGRDGHDVLVAYANASRGGKGDAAASKGHHVGNASGVVVVQDRGGHLQKNGQHLTRHAARSAREVFPTLQAFMRYFTTPGKHAPSRARYELMHQYNIRTGKRMWFTFRPECFLAILHTWLSGCRENGGAMSEYYANAVAKLLARVDEEIQILSKYYDMDEAGVSSAKASFANLVKLLGQATLHKPEKATKSTANKYVHSVGGSSRIVAAVSSVEALNNTRNTDKLTSLPGVSHANNLPDYDGKNLAKPGPITPLEDMAAETQSLKGGYLVGSDGNEGNAYMEQFHSAESGPGGSAFRTTMPAARDLLDQKKVVVIGGLLGAFTPGTMSSRGETQSDGITPSSRDSVSRPTAVPGVPRTLGVQGAIVLHAGTVNRNVGVEEAILLVMRSYALLKEAFSGEPAVGAVEYEEWQHDVTVSVGDAETAKELIECDRKRGDIPKHGDDIEDIACSARAALSLLCSDEASKPFAIVMGGSSGYVALPSGEHVQVSTRVA